MKMVLYLIVTSVMLHSYGQTDTVVVVHKIGDHFGGGIIFYIDETGQHGLISVSYDQGSKIFWGLEGTTGASFLSDGEQNTLMIKKFTEDDRNTPLQLNEGWNNPLKAGANICDTLVIEGYTDWYLPSIKELRKMFNAQELIGGFMAKDYLSSTEYNKKYSWNIHFAPNKEIEFRCPKMKNSNNVRCIRKF